MRISRSNFEGGNCINRHKTVSMLVVVRVVATQCRLRLTRNFAGSFNTDSLHQSLGMFFQVIACCIHRHIP